MAQQDFQHDAFRTMMPYLDDRSKARVVETRRDAVGDHQLCKPDEHVYRAHSVNRMCPAYATTLEIDTGCCTTSFQNANPSDREFLAALNYGYQFQLQPWGKSHRYSLDQIVPDIRRWFESGRNNIQMPAALPATLVIDMTRNWFSLVMKFYILTRPRFQIDAFDPNTGVTHMVYDAFSNVRLASTQPFILRRRIVKCIQDVGTFSVGESLTSGIPFVPFALKCQHYKCNGASIVDITDMANTVLPDVRCGSNRMQDLDFLAVAAVRTGSWVDAFVNIFLAASRRQFIDIFEMKVKHTPTAGHVFQLPQGMTAIPQAGSLPDAQQYQVVVDRLVSGLPGNSNNWKVDDVSNDVAGQGSWYRTWKVTSSVHHYSFDLRVRSSYVRLRCWAL